MKKILLLFIILIAQLSIPIAAQTDKKIQNLKTESKSIKNKINNSQKLLISTKKDVHSQLSNLNILNEKIDQQENYIKLIQDSINEIQHNINALEKELVKQRKELSNCKKKYAQSILYMYRNRNIENELMFIFSVQNFQQMYRRIRYIKEYAKYQKAQGDIIKQKEIKIRNKQNFLLQTKSKKSLMLSKQLLEQQKLRQKKEERSTLLEGLQHKQKDIQYVINKNQRRYASLSKAIDKLIQEQIAAAKRRHEEEERIKKEALSKKAKGKRKTSTKSKTLENITKTKKTTKSPAFKIRNSEKQLSSTFTLNKGKFPMPITGPYVISSHYGHYTMKGLKNVQLDNKGINITGKHGAKARSIFTGRVSAIFSFNGNFNILIRHGDYISVYCNLSKVEVHQDQNVATLQILGTITDDDTGHSTLHFELRKETSKLNPQSWLDD